MWVVLEDSVFKKWGGLGYQKNELIRQRKDVK